MYTYVFPNLGFFFAAQSLQVEVGELKGRLTEVMSNCDALCRRIAADGPPQLRSSVRPFASDDCNVDRDRTEPPP